MDNSFLPFALPDIGEEEITEVVDSLRSGWITTGPKTRKFEEDFGNFIGNDVTAIAVNSATAGLHLALEAVGVGQGDEVITTTYTFTSTAEIVRYLGADPVFVDISPQTFNIDHRQIESKITPRTRAIIPVHFAGMPCNMDAIIALAKKHNIAVIEDAAHALPSKYQGKIIGALESDATVFSFYATKNITTGEGGMVVTRNPDIAHRCRVMRLHGIDRDVFDRYSSTKPSWWYEVVAPGYKYNMTDIAAAMGIHQLRKIKHFLQKRQEIARQYMEGLKDLPLILPPGEQPGDVHAWHLFVIRLTPAAPLDRQTFIERMTESGIGCSVHFIPLHLQPFWRETFNLQPQDFPNALDVFNAAVSLPLYTRMSEHDVERVIRNVRKILTT